MKPTRQHFQSLLIINTGLFLFCLVVAYRLNLGLEIAKWMTITFAVLLMWLIITSIIGVLYVLGLVEEINLSPFIPSKDCRTFLRELKERPEISDAIFFSRYYAATEIPITIIGGVRRSLVKQYPLASRVLPEDNIQRLDDELDFAEVFRWIGQEVGIRFRSSDYLMLSGTLDNLFRITFEKVLSQSGPGK